MSDDYDKMCAALLHEWKAGYNHNDEAAQRGAKDVARQLGDYEVLKHLEKIDPVLVKKGRASWKNLGYSRN